MRICDALPEAATQSAYDQLFAAAMKLIGTIKDATSQKKLKHFFEWWDRRRDHFVEVFKPGLLSFGQYLHRLCLLNKCTCHEEKRNLSGSGIPYPDVCASPLERL